MPLYEKLDACQQKAVRRGIAKKSVCIYFEQGVGKTHPTISIIEEIIADNSKFEGFLVVKLANIETTWEAMMNEHLPQVHYTRDYKEFKKLPPPKILLTHYEGMVGMRKFLQTHIWTFGAFDESQGLKARGTKQSRIAGLIKSCEYRLALSGTPIDGNEIDFFGQLRWVAPQLYGNDRSAWKRFDENYLKPTGYMGYKRKFREEMLPVFLAEVAPYMLRVMAEDVLDLPKCRIQLEPVDMYGEQLRVYDAMEKKMVAHIKRIITDKKAMKERAAELEEQGFSKAAAKIRAEATRISAGLKITQMIKLQQVTGGYVVDDEGDINILPNAKLRKLKHLLKRKAQLPVVIFCKYTQERIHIENLLREMNITFGAIHGKSKDTKRKKTRSDAIRAFQAGKLQAMVCQVKAGGVGVDLFRARSAIFFSSTFSFIDYDQCKKRIHRRGQINETTIFYIYVEKSIDEDIYSTILSKRSVSKNAFILMKRRLSNG